MEPDEEKVRHAAGIMARQLAGSLALVTCKEPLKVSMTNYIRMIQQEVLDQPMPEGLILMCVNDNLDAACGIVEKAAEEKSLPEIEKMVEPQLEARRRHLATRPNEAFMDPSMNRWGFYIPEPYRQTPGGLNKEQLAIYEEFARQSRGTAAAVHPQNVSADAGRQLPDVLQESYPAIPNLSTPAEQPAVPHRTPRRRLLHRSAVYTPMVLSTPKTHERKLSLSSPNSNRPLARPQRNVSKTLAGTVLFFKNTIRLCALFWPHQMARSWHD